MSFPEEEQPKPIEPASSEEPITPSEPAASEELFAPGEPAPSEASPTEQAVFPEAPGLPEDFTPLSRPESLPRARRRRARRMLVMPGADERAAILEGLAQRAFPSLEFFVFALLGGAVLGVAYLLDSPALLLLGILLAPLLTPWVGLILAIQTGSWRFFFQTLIGLAVACLLVFLTGALAGWVGHIWMPLPLSKAIFHAHLWWPDLFLVALGAVLLAISFIRSEHRPTLPSIMLAYGLFLPLSAGGVGLGIGSPTIWPDGVLVFVVHLALASFIGIITLAILRFKPAHASGYVLPILVGLVCLAGLAYLTGLTAVVRNGFMVTRQTIPSPTMLPLPTDTPTSPPTATMTSTFTLTATPQPTGTPQPTPVYAVIAASSGGGAYIRTDPGGGNALAVLVNGTVLQVFPEIQSVKGLSWVHVRWNDMDGWVLLNALKETTKTPLPPTATFTPTP
ncbi:MAG TPA: DUF389 domain-containing protein [Anaerolineales bacterium]|nr:DUF389 domain-containing protein [Anaerolineales bacterium]